MKETIILDLGGSIVVPDVGRINISFVKKFRSLVLKQIRRKKLFIIIVGGGQIARDYQKASKEVIGRLSKEDRDWIGITATRQNAWFLHSIFRKYTAPEILWNPHNPHEGKSRKPVLIGGGFRPGYSTDYVSVLWAKRFGAQKVIDASNIKWVYNKDPKRYKTAKPVKKISWKEYRRIIPKKWTPGLNLPVDPIAAREAEKSKIKFVVADGNNLRNLENIIEGKKFKGTIIC